MKIKGAYITIKKLLYTYLELSIGDDTNSIHLPENRKLIIPDYQREYRWEEKQLFDLFEDLNKQNGYLGQIALINDPNNNDAIYIVDGQQRITSLILLISALCRALKMIGDNNGFNEYDLHLEQERIGNRRRLCFKANSFDDFQKFISDIYNIANDDDIQNHSCTGIDSYFQTERYLNAYSTFVNQITKSFERYADKHEKAEKIKEYINKILSTKISIVFIESDSNFEGESVFLDVNEKGLKLDNEDILKGYYFKKLSPEIGNEALEVWKQIKTNFFELKNSINSKKINLEFLANYFLEIILTSSGEEYLPENFDDSLRYKTDNGKKHICELFFGEELHTAMKKLSCFIKDINILLNSDISSPEYASFDESDENRKVIKSLIMSIAKSNMRIVFIALIKFWVLRDKAHLKLSRDNFLQIYAFYIICCISSRRKERKIFSNDFMHAENVLSLHNSLYDIEKDILDEIYYSAKALKGDQKKAEYLSYGIQKFYNEFRYDIDNRKWKLINQREFLSDYSTDNRKKLKDHFLVQKSNKILVNEAVTIDTSGSLNKYKSRAYNYLYHVDDFENKDFVYRLNVINHQASEEERSGYKRYECDYFSYLEEQLFSFYDIDPNTENAWDLVLDKHKDVNQADFERLIQRILDDKIFDWHKTVCDHFRGLMEEN